MPSRSLRLPGYTQPVGEHLKYIIFSAKRPIACFAFASAPYKTVTAINLLAGLLKHLREIITCLGNAPDVSHQIGKRSINTQFSGWKHSLTQTALKQHVIGQKI